MGVAAAPGTDDVRRIAAIESPVIRNLEITECYSRLAAAVAARSGEGANWCTYATWASRQAGHAIRGEDMLDGLQRHLAGSHWLLHPFATLWRRLLRRGLFDPGTRLGRLTAALHTPFDAFERASDAVARGNLKVFAEIGLEFARFLEECPADATDLAAVHAFVERLRPGDPPDGQRYLAQAFVRYEEQRVSADARARTELAVLANLEIGLHEQTRLEPEIREALDAADATREDLERRALEALFPSPSRWRRAVAPLARFVGARVQRAASEVAREVITETLMVLSLPGRVLALGANLADALPGDLREPADPELKELVARYEPVPPAIDDCGSTDWSILEQRMHYISHLFRCFHLDAGLAGPPFTPEQVESIRRGDMPGGAL